MQTMLETIARPEAAAAVAALVGLAFGWMKRLAAKREWNLARALECVEAGVRETYEEYVRAAKEAADDGRLTDRERREALDRAVRRAGEYAARDGVDLAACYAKEYLPVLVDRVVQSRKTGVPLRAGE